MQTTTRWNQRKINRQRENTIEIYYILYYAVKLFALLFIGLDCILNWPHSTILVNIHTQYIFMYRDLISFPRLFKGMSAWATLPTCFENSNVSPCMEVEVGGNRYINKYSTPM